MFFLSGKRTKALFMSLWMVMFSLLPSVSNASTFSAAERTVGAGAAAFGAVVNDYHPESVFATYEQTLGASVKQVNTVGGSQVTYANAITAPDNFSKDGGDASGLVSSAASAVVDAALAGTATATTGAGIASVVVGTEVAAGTGSFLVGSAAAAGASSGVVGALSAVAAAMPYVAIVLVIFAIFDLFGGEYQWSGECAARTGASCTGWYDSNGYTHVGFGLYVPTSLISSYVGDVNNQQLGEQISEVTSDKNSDPDAIFDANGKKLKGNYSMYVDQGNDLLTGYHPLKNSVLISNVKQLQTVGWNEEVVYKGVEAVQLYMYTYAPSTPWTGS